jgi:hypothetical protein
LYHLFVQARVSPKSHSDRTLRWILFGAFGALILYYHWALVANMPRLALFDQKTAFPSWLIAALTHLAGIASVFAFAGLVKGRKPLTESLLALSMCVVAMGRFCSDGVLDRLEKGDGMEGYPAKFGIAMIFLVLGVALQVISLTAFKEPAPTE